MAREEGYCADPANKTFVTWPGGIRVELLAYGRERVWFPWSRRAREGFLGLALWDFLRTDLTDPEARADLWRRWRVSHYDARGFLRPIPIARVPLSRLLNEQRALQGAVESLPGRPPTTARRSPDRLDDHRLRLHGAWQKVGMSPERLRPLGIRFEDVRPELATDGGVWLHRKGHTKGVRKAIVEDLAAWYRHPPGDFFWLCWWELKHADRLKKPGRRCQECNAPFIAGYGNERYCPSHRNPAARKRVERRKRVGRRERQLWAER